MPDGSEHLLFVFRLHGAAVERTLYLRDLDGERDYTLTWLMGGRCERRHGADLMRQGITVHTLREEESAIIHIA